MLILVFEDVQKGKVKEGIFLSVVNTSQIIGKELDFVLVYRFAIKSLRGSLH